MSVQNVTTADRLPLLYNLCGCKLLSLDASTRVIVTPQSVSQSVQHPITSTRRRWRTNCVCIPGQPR
ncbi:hypothetical protein pipiens_020059, partial [Culex pipiens pipiens]